MVDVILDIDAAGDDILAVLYGAFHSKINLLAVTTSCGASGSIEQASWVALNTLDIAGQTDIPVYSGAQGPLNPQAADDLESPVHFDDELRWKFGDRLDKFNTPAARPARMPESMAASDYLVQAFNERPGEISLVVTGPLTNIAMALQKDPGIAKKIKHAYIMGGCFKTPGNITPVTEYNIWADPEAAKIVFNSGMTITCVPLDICEDNRFACGMFTRDHIADLVNQGSGKAVEFIADKFPIYIDIWREYFKLGGFPMDDAIALALTVEEDLCQYTSPVYIDIELEGTLSRGQTVAYFGHQILKTGRDKQPNSRIATYLDGRRFIDGFVDVILERR